MPMLIISDEQLVNELKSNGNQNEPARPVKVVDIKRGRGSINEIPQSLREVIAEEAISGTPAKVISEHFGISESSISAYKHGATSTASYNNPNQDLTQANNDVKSSLTDSARQALQAALAEITPDKLSLTKVRDAAGIAKDMSAVMKNLEPTNVFQNQSNVQVVIYKPRTKEEDDYDVITVNE